MFISFLTKISLYLKLSGLKTWDASTDLLDEFNVLFWLFAMIPKWWLRAALTQASPQHIPAHPAAAGRRDQPGSGRGGVVRWAGKIIIVSMALILL